MMEIARIPYRAYKTSYPDCEAVAGSYDKSTRSIEVIIPDGRRKASGTRGRRYGYYHFNGIERGTERPVQITIKAVSVGNAIKRLPRDCDWDIN